MNTSLSSNNKQVYQMQNEIYWPNANFDIEQLQRLAAKKVDTRLGQLTAKDIFKFIRSWQNESIGKEIIRYRWDYNKSSFDVKKLLRLLRVNDHQKRKIEIKHYYEAGKQAILMVNRLSLKFRAILRDSDYYSDSDSDSDF